MSRKHNEYRIVAQAWAYHGNSYARYFLVLCLLLLLRPAIAQDAPRPKAPKPLILILCDSLTWDDVASSHSPNLSDFASGGAVGLMNGAIVGKPDSPAPLLTLATGQHIAAEPEDAFAANDNEHITEEQGDALTLYRRRTGKLSHKPVVDGIVHLHIASLARRGINTQTVGAVLASANPPIPTAIYGNISADSVSRTAALFALDSMGRGTGRFDIFRPLPAAPNVNRDDPIRLSQLIGEHPKGLTVLVVNSVNSLEILLSLLAEHWQYHDQLEPGVEDTHAEIWVMASRSHPGQNRLIPVIFSGSQDLLTSATTHTTALIANTDIAPSILAHFGISTPPNMIGKPIQRLSLTGKKHYSIPARLDFVTQLNDQALHHVMPIFVGVFAVYFLILFLRSQPPRWLVFGIVPLLFLPAALLLAPILIPPTLWEYALRIVAWQFGLAFFALALARISRCNLPVTVALTNIALILGDILTGQNLLKDSRLSGYALSGIRYYGIGNEYLGVVLAFALTSTFLALPPSPPGTFSQTSLGRGGDSNLPSPSEERAKQGEGSGVRAVLVLAWMAILIVLGWVGWGANAGSLAAGGAGFGIGAAILYGRRPTWKLAILCVVFGLLLAFAFGGIEAFLLPTQKNGGSSHFGSVLRTAANQNNAGYLLEIAARKAAMNLRLFLLPSFLAMLALLSIAGFLGYCRFHSMLNTTFPPESWIRRSLPAFAATTVSALIFKDSGVVTVAFFLALSAFLLLFAALTKTSKGQNENQSPS